MEPVSGNTKVLSAHSLTVSCCRPAGVGEPCNFTCNKESNTNLSPRKVCLQVHETHSAVYLQLLAGREILKSYSLLLGMKILINWMTPRDRWAQRQSLMSQHLLGIIEGHASSLWEKSITHYCQITGPLCGMSLMNKQRRRDGHCVYINSSYIYMCHTPFITPTGKRTATQMNERSVYSMCENGGQEMVR